MNLTLEQKVGQVFMFGFPSRDPEGAAELVKDLHAGGIIYMARNLDTVEQAADLSRTLQNWAMSSPPGIPLFIAADQEGGIVARLTKGVPLMPGPMSLAAASLGLTSVRPDEGPASTCPGKSPAGEELVRRAYYSSGIQLRAAGINVNLAPVLDVNDNPENPVIGVRSFGQDSKLVSRYGVEAVSGIMSAGVMPVGKHFPGHGNTSVDSHLDLPVLPHPMERLNNIELKPFRAAIGAGIPAIMTAHIVFQAIDPELPATLSEKVLRGLLRRDLGFRGIIITDCMEMAAIAKDPGTVRGAVMALKAGADIVVICHTKKLQRAAYEAVLYAVRSGELPESRLDEAVERILTVKRKLGLPNPLPPNQATCPDFWTFSKEAHLASITVVKDENHLLPLRKRSPEDEAPLRVLLAYAKGRPNRPGTSPLSPLGEYLAQEGVTVEEIYLEPGARQDGGDPTEQLGGGAPTQQQGAGDLGQPRERYSLAGPQRSSEPATLPDRSPDVLSRAIEKAAAADAVIILTRNAASDEAQVLRASALAARDVRCIHVATGNPHDLRIVKGVGTCICTYSHKPEAMEALAQVLLGLRRATGVAPVEFDT